MIDTGKFLNCVHNLPQMLNIRHLYFKDVNAHPINSTLNVSTHNISLAVTYRLTDVGKNPLLIMAGNSDFYRKRGFFVSAPDNFDSSFRIAAKCGWTIYCMNRNASASGNKADDFISGEWIAAFTEPDHDIINATDLYCTGRLPLETVKDLGNAGLGFF